MKELHVDAGASSRRDDRPSASRELPLGDIVPRGWLADQLELQSTGLTGQLEDLWADVGPDSGWLGGDGESWERGPYYLDGLVPLAYILKDERLIARAEPWIEWMLSSQREDGFFGPIVNDDWWPRMVAVKVLTQYHDATGDDRVIPFLSRWFAYQLEELPLRPLISWGTARGADNALGVWWLYERTGDDRLLELIDLLSAQTADWETYLTTDLITGPARVFSRFTHGPNVAMGLKTGAVNFLRDGDPEHESATESSFAALSRWHGQAHGWFSGDEWLGGREATAGIETCQVVEMMFTTEQLARVYGDGRHGDRLESLAFNLLAAACDPRMTSHQYLQQANQVQVSVAHRPWTYSGDDANMFGLDPHYGCCTANLHQGWPKFVRSLWVVDADEALRVVAYAPAMVSTTIHGEEVRLEVETEYPFRETIRVHVTTEARTPFPIRLRIPEWADGFDLSVDGYDTRPPVVEGYVDLVENWSGRSTIELRLPMAPRVTRRERQSAAVGFGPLVLSMGVAENWRAVENAPGLGEWEIYPRSSWNFALDLSSPVSEWVVERRPVSSRPFESGSGLALTVTGAQVDAWELHGNQAGPPPASPVADHGPLVALTLVPYGTARIRVTEFPVVGLGSA